MVCGRRAPVPASSRRRHADELARVGRSRDRVDPLSACTGIGDHRLCLRARSDNRIGQRNAHPRPECGDARSVACLAHAEQPRRPGGHDPVTQWLAYLRHRNLRANRSGADAAGRFEFRYILVTKQRLRGGQRLLPYRPLLRPRRESRLFAVDLFQRHDLPDRDRPSRIGERHQCAMHRRWRWHRLPPICIGRHWRHDQPDRHRHRLARRAARAGRTRHPLRPRQFAEFRLLAQRWRQPRRDPQRSGLGLAFGRGDRPLRAVAVHCGNPALFGPGRCRAVDGEHHGHQRRLRLFLGSDGHRFRWRRHRRVSLRSQLRHFGRPGHDRPRPPAGAKLHQRADPRFLGRRRQRRGGDRQSRHLGLGRRNGPGRLSQRGNPLHHPLPDLSLALRRFPPTLAAGSLRRVRPSILSCARSDR